MNQEELEKYIGLFDDYLDGHLDEIDHNALKSALNNNSDLRTELALHVEARADIRSAGEDIQKKYFLSKLQEAPVKTTSSENGSRRPLWIAIGILYLIAFILFLFFKMDMDKKLIPAQREPMAYLEDPSPQLLRSDAQAINSIWDNAIAAYATKDYKTALGYFDTLKEDASFAEQHGGKLNLYTGIAYTRLGSYNKALSSFQNISVENPFYDQAQWYEALTYLISDEKDQAIIHLKKISEIENHYKKAQATSLLDSIQ